jgi:hypothetical protein
VRSLADAPQTVRFLSKTLADRYAERECGDVEAARKCAAAADPYGLDLRTHDPMTFLGVNGSRPSLKQRMPPMT